MQILGIDVGGSGIKAAVVNTDTGELSSDRLRFPTPKPATAEAITEIIGLICKSFKWTSDTIIF